MNFKALLLTATVAITGAVAAPAQAWETYHVADYSGTRSTVKVLKNNFPMVTVRTNDSYSGVQLTKTINCSTRQLRWDEAIPGNLTPSFKSVTPDSSNEALVDYFCPKF